MALTGASRATNSAIWGSSMGAMRRPILICARWQFMADSRRLLPKDASEIKTVAQNASPPEVADKRKNALPEKGGRRGSKAEQIGDFDEDLAAIIQKAIGNVEEVPVGIQAEAGIKILKVAVVTEIDSSAGMEKISEEQIGVEVFGRLERSQALVGEDCRILADEAKREFASELVVPLGTDNVVVEDAGTPVEAAEAREQVGVVNGEFSRRAHGEINLRVAGIGEEGAAQYGSCGGSVEVGVRAPAYLAVQGELLEETRLEEETGMTVGVIPVARKRAEVDWPKAFVAEIAEEAEKYLALKLKTVIGVGKPFETCALVIPIVDGEQAGAMPNQVLPFRTKTVESELAEAANVRAAKETGLGLEAL